MIRLNPESRPGLAWMVQARPILHALNAHATKIGREPKAARFIGGCIRDALIGLDAQDVDIATVLPPQEVMAAGKAMGIKVHPIGLAHGTVTLVHNNMTYEVTTLRQDVNTDGRHAQVTFTDDWKVDASRRDFTFNALSADETGKVYDFFEGAADLQAGIVRFIGKADRRIEEDFLRMLRFFRFFAFFGRGAPVKEALVAIRRHAAQLARLAPERVAIELLKLLSARDPAPAWIAAREAGLDLLGFDDLKIEEDADSLRRLTRLQDLPPDPLWRLGALMPTSQAPRAAAGVAARLRLSRQHRRRLATLAEDKALVESWQDIDLKRFLLTHGRERTQDAAAMHAALTERDHLLRLARTAPCPPFPLRGNDLKGLRAGPELGQLLNQVRAWWIERGGQDDHQACLAYAQQQHGDQDS